MTDHQDPAGTPPENRVAEGGRDDLGRFVPGQSGNPGGRSKSLTAIRQLAREHAETALQKLVELLESNNERVRLDAIRELLDRGFGRPQQAIDLSFLDADLAGVIRELSDDEKRAVALGDMRPLLKRRTQWTK